jgi:hypothetical protein
MKTVARVLALLTGAVLITSVLGTVAALAAKRRIVPLAEPGGDEVRLAAIFAPLHFHSTATAFRGGSVDCWYGGGVVDLRDATLDPAGARLTVRLVFGGGQVLVPDGWRVTSSIQGIGGMGDMRPALDRPLDAPHLTIDGIVVFGGFSVASAMPEAQLRGLETAVASLEERRSQRAASAG